MKKKNLILYIVLAGIILLGGVLGIVVALLMGNTLAEMFSSKIALTIYIALAAFLVVFATLAIYEWGRK